MAGYTLDTSNQMQSGDFPDYLQGGAPVGALRNARKQLGSLFDFNPIAQTGNQYIASSFANQQNSVNAASRAAQNRAMLNGGRVGASYAGASAMLPLYQQRNQQAFQLAGLQGQMNSQRAGLLAQISQGITSANLQNRGLLANYGLGQQRLSQDQGQFDQDFGLRQQLADSDLAMSAERLRQLRMQNDQNQTMFDRALNPQRRNWAQFSPSWGGGINPLNPSSLSNV